MNVGKNVAMESKNTIKSKCFVSSDLRYFCVFYYTNTKGCNEIIKFSVVNSYRRIKLSEFPSTSTVIIPLIALVL